MKNNKNVPAMMIRCLLVFWCFSALPLQASVVNLTWVEDVTSFSSTWRITDNSAGDFSGSAYVYGSYWQVEMVTDAMPNLQETIGHILGPHGESFTASSFDYGVLPTGLFTEDSFVGHDDHQDAFALTSLFVDGGYNISVSGVHLVPVPAALWLFGSGLAMLGWLRRRT